MKILALDSTAAVSSAALSEDGKLVAEFTMNTGNTHSETLLPLIEQMLKLTKTEIEDIDLFACASGPGSFTGVRIGAATLKGLAFGKNKPCAEISSLEGLAYNLCGYDGILSPVINAGRGQVYNSLFSCEGGNITRLCPDRLISPDELARELIAYAPNVYLAGDGYDMAVSALTDGAFTHVPHKLRLFSAYSVCLAAKKAYDNGNCVTDKELSPSYLRLCQAESERNKRLGISE